MIPKMRRSEACLHAKVGAMAFGQKLQMPSKAGHLAGELHSEVRHEYVAGSLYAMVGGTARRNLISLALAARLRAYLVGMNCRTFMSAMKLCSGSAFYYPDVLVA